MCEFLSKFHNIIALISNAPETISQRSQMVRRRTLDNSDLNIKPAGLSV